MTVKLTPALKKRITADWHALFPSMGVYRPLWLARRVGPLVQGICLDRASGNDTYLPTTHVHCACRELPAVTLTLAQRLRTARHGVDDRIPAARHGEHHREAARRLAGASLLPLEGDLTLDQVLDAYERYRGLDELASRYPVDLFEDAIALLCWAGRADEAARRLEAHAAELAAWPPSAAAPFGGVARWREGLRALVSHPERAREVAERQLVALGLDHLPAAALRT